MVGIVSCHSVCGCLSLAHLGTDSTVQLFLFNFFFHVVSHFLWGFLYCCSEFWEQVLKSLHSLSNLNLRGSPICSVDDFAEEVTFIMCFKIIYFYTLYLSVGAELESGGFADRVTKSSC